MKRGVWGLDEWIGCGEMYETMLPGKLLTSSGPDHNHTASLTDEWDIRPKNLVATRLKSRTRCKFDMEVSINGDTPIAGWFLLGTYLNG